MQLKRNKEMEFETLKKSHKKQIAIGAIAVCIVGGALTFATSRAKYRVTEDIPLVSGTVNYKAYDFKIMAMYKSDDGVNYSEITTMPEEYVINESKSYCTTDNVNKNTSAVLKTIDGNHVISKLAKSDKCYIYFDKYRNETTALGTLKVNYTKPDFSKTVKTDEGIYAAPDGMYGGISYYWRGAATTNYLKFAGFCWRIIRINGDGTIRIIYDGTTCHANGTNTAESIAVANQAYNSSYNNSSYVGWTYTVNSQRPVAGSETTSNAKTQTETWYNNNVGNNATYAAKVADGKFCNERATYNNEAWIATEAAQNYAAGLRAFEPILDCSLQDIYTLKVGAITVDEAKYAGGTDGDNYSYYLYNGQYYWTMSPSRWSGTYAIVGRILARGAVNSWEVYDPRVGLRPVINLKAHTTFSGGNGTISSPYIVSD